MKYRLCVGFSLCVWLAAARAAGLSDTEAGKFLNDRGCNACHGVDEMRIGPAFRMVAARYPSASEQVLDALAQKIRHGGAGSWGVVPMISNPGIPDAEIRAIVQWIFSLKGVDAPAKT